MKIAHIVPFIGDLASGTAYSVPSICEALGHQGNDVALHTLAPCPTVRDTEVIAYPRHQWPHPSMGRSPEMKRGVIEHSKNADIVHNHGLWMFNNIYPTRAAAEAKCPLVCSPHGTMAPHAWARSRWKKIIMGWLGQNAGLRATDMFHATSEAECLDIRRLGFKQPITMIENGIHIDDFPSEVNRKNIVLFLGRVHPIKGVDLLLEAWRLIAERYPEWELHIAGPKIPSYYAQLETTIQKFNIQRVKFLGALFGSDKDDAYYSAKYFVLPTHTENFGMVVAEALTHEVPCIVTKGAPWQGLEEKNCGWWIERSLETLTNALITALDTPETERAAMGQRGRAWMERDSSWDEAARKMLAAYNWLLHDEARPSWVHLD